MELFKVPAVSERIGPLAKHNSHKLFLSVSQEIKEYLENTHENSAECLLDTAMHYMLGEREMCDTRVIRLALGYLAAARIEMKMKLYHRKLKKLQKCLNLFTLEFPHTVESVVNILLFMDYVYSNRVGKAEKYLVKARDCSKKTGISMWSVDVLDCEASMCLTLAQLRPNKRQQYLNSALYFYCLATDHCLHGIGTFPDDAHLFKAALYLCHQAFIVLDMPSPGILRLFHATDILMQHGKVSDVTSKRIIKAKSLLEAAQTHIQQCSGMYQENMRNYLLKGDIYTEIRKAQYFITERFYKCAITSLQKARNLHQTWCALYAQDQITSTSAFAVQTPSLFDFLEDLPILKVNRSTEIPERQAIETTTGLSLHDSCCLVNTDRVLLFSGATFSPNVLLPEKSGAGEQEKVQPANYLGDNEPIESPVFDETSGNEFSHESEEF